MLAAVGQGFGFLLEKPQLLQVVRRQADQVALAGDGNLQRLPDPPGGVRRQAGAVADVEAVNRLHQAAHRFLQQVGIPQSVMAETLGHVGGQADVGRGQAVLAMDVTVVNPANGGNLAGFSVAVIADELGHRPGFQGRPMSTKPREMPYQDADQLTLTLPEGRQQLAFFFRGEQIGREDGGAG